MIDLVINNPECKAWLEETDVMEQLNALSWYKDYEDCHYIYECRSLDELLSLYLFVCYIIGVEFVEAVHELIEEEDEKTIDLVKEFNKQIGREIISL